MNYIKPVKKNKLTNFVTYIVIVFLGASASRGVPTLANQRWGNSEERIVGGSDATAGQFPYILSMQTTGHFCGATLISQTWAVTAAHCLE